MLSWGRKVFWCFLFVGLLFFIYQPYISGILVTVFLYLEKFIFLTLYYYLHTFPNQVTDSSIKIALRYTLYINTLV